MPICKACARRTAVLAPLFINGHYRRFAVVANGVTKETQRSGGIPFGGQQKFYGLPHTVNGAVQLFPLPFDCRFRPFDINAPRCVYREDLIQQRNQVDNPAMKGGMVNDNTALRHHLFQAAQAQGVRQIPATFCAIISTG